ncbi:MAG: GlxA family transcriptional regulator [Reyranellaceae bacterium]
MRLAILLLPGVMPSAVIGIGDLLALANYVLERQGRKPRFSWRTLSVDGRSVRAARGVSLAADDAIGARVTCDAVIVPGFLAEPSPPGRPGGGRAAAIAGRRRQHAPGRGIGAICSGVILLGEAGQLDGPRSAITWWLQSELKARYARIELAHDAVVTQAERIVCAAGPMSWVDLLLRLIEMIDGAELARLCADHAVIDTSGRTQAHYVPVGYMRQRDPLLVEAEMLVRCAGDEPMTVRRLAHSLKLSERTLHRRFTGLTGDSPQAFIAHTRIGMARTLLETGTQPIKTIARAVGYDDEGSFRRAFRKQTATSPQAYRQRRSTPRFSDGPAPPRP